MEMVFGNATGVPLNVKLAGDVRETTYIESAGGASYSNHIVITYSSYIESAGGAGVWWRVGGGGTARNGCVVGCGCVGYHGGEGDSGVSAPPVVLYHCSLPTPHLSRGSQACQRSHTPRKNGRTKIGI